VVIAPRRARVYVGRAAYVAALLVLMSTAWLILTGTQMVRDTGDLARFGAVLFQILAPLQLAVVMFFSAILAANAVAQEKDRKTLVLLLLTHLSNSELVLGRLMASLLNVLVMLAAAAPLFMLAALLGGVSFGQIGAVFAVTLASVLACGSLGSTLALWREKTFQSLAMTVLVLVLWLAIGEVVAAGVFGNSLAGMSSADCAAMLSPWRAVLIATHPYLQTHPAWGVLASPVHVFLLVAVVISLLLDGVGVAMVRVWNPSREARLQSAEEEAAPKNESIWGEQRDLAGVAAGEKVAGGEKEAKGDSPIFVERKLGQSPTRHVWDNPILWREMRTWAYGRKILVIRLVYLLLFGLAAASLHSAVAAGSAMTAAQGAAALVPLLLLSLVLVNAQSVTSMTSERDSRALDLLLATDLTPKEIVFGKLGGVFYNTKEMLLLPMLLCGYLWFARELSLENLLYVLGGAAVLYLFVAVLGIHAGMNYASSRSAIATSLGTVFFLFVGVATCMRMMVAFSGSFQAQLQPFLAFMIGGGVGLYVALGARNPSTAIGAASFICPFATFYAITSFLLDYTLGVFLVTAAAYGFTTAAMLVPAIYEFDVATGRTTE
jgi:ABC-type transport system involved in multi-copper enzyme maturation permease subunit